ncbi:MAG: hypothetical protein QXU99_08075 [Candidatus Bathyarchaeia archaeon]
MFTVVRSIHDAPRLTLYESNIYELDMPVPQAVKLPEMSTLKFA